MGVTVEDGLGVMRSLTAIVVTANDLPAVARWPCATRSASWWAAKTGRYGFRTYRLDDDGAVNAYRKRCTTPSLINLQAVAPLCLLATLHLYFALP